MEDALMLFTGAVVPISEVSDGSTFDPNDPHMSFFDDYIEHHFGQNADIQRKGRLRSFKKAGVAYMAIFDSSTHRFAGYFDEDKFWEHNYMTRNKRQSSASYHDLGPKFSTPLEFTSSEYMVHFVQKNVEQVGDQFVLSVKYKETPRSSLQLMSNRLGYLDHYDSVQVNVINGLTTPVDPILDAYGNFVINKKFIDGLGDLVPLGNGEQNVLYDVVYLLHELYSDDALMNKFSSLGIADAFLAHTNLANRFNQDFTIVDPKYHPIYNDEFFARLRLRLLELSNWLKKFNGVYDDMDDDDNGELSAYVGHVFPIPELSYLSYDTKLRLLNLILKDNAWLIGDWYFNDLNEEKIVVKLVSAIARETNGVLNISEINAFLDLLNSNYDNTHRTLFVTLYFKIDDNQFFEEVGQGTLTQFIMEVYKMWLVSPKNPDNIYDLDMYSQVIDTWYEQYASSPAILNYESKKGWLHFSDNMTFYFVKNKIAIMESIEYTEKEIVYGAGDETEEVEVTRVKNISRGSYDIYQTMTLNDINPNDTAIAIPRIAFADQNTCNIPLFLLTYIDQYGDAEDTLATAEVIFDVATTFTGIGNLAKLRHLRHITKLGRLALGLPVTAGERVLALELLSGGLGLVELTTSLASLILQYYTQGCTIYMDGDDNAAVNEPEHKGINDYVNNDNPNPEIPEQPNNPAYGPCKALDRWLFWVQIATVSTDIVANFMVRKASRDVLDAGLPVNFPLDVSDELNDVLNKWAGNLTEITNEFANRVNTLIGSNSVFLSDLAAMTNMERRQFLYQFKKATDEEILKLGEVALDDLNAPRSLAREWNDVELIFNARSRVSTLISLRCANRPQIMDKLKALTQHGNKWVGGHLGSNLFDQSRTIFGWLDPAKTVVTKTYGTRIYKQVDRGILMRKQGWVNPHTSPPPLEFNNVHVKRKDNLHTWIENISDREFMEEIALVHTKASGMAYDATGQKRIYGQFTDGCKVTLIVRKEIVINGVTYNDHITAVLMNP